LPGDSGIFAAVRILTKYLLREFAWPLLYCFDAFAMLWVVLDLFGHLDDFIVNHASLATVFRYYLTLFPEGFVEILPMTLLLALLFCLTNLGRHNELIAMRVSGVSLARLALPLLGVGVLATVLVFAAGERLVPRARERAEALLKAVHGKAASETLDGFYFSSATEHRDWYARRFNTLTGEMDSPEIHERNPDGTARLDVYAKRATWQKGFWRFYDVDLYDYARGSAPPHFPVAVTNFLAFKDPPQRMALEGKASAQMTSSELRQQIRVLRRSGRAHRLPELEVELQDRYAFPFICLIVVWIAIPLGMRVSRRGPLLAVGTALVLVVAFYILHQWMKAAGRGGHLAPVAAAWLNNVIFTAIGAVLAWRAR
jgi:LPS export ABC transporter permease LptG